MSGTYTWPQVVNGKTYQQSDFSPYGYATNLPDLLGNFAAQASSAQGAVQAANASASAAAAAVSAAQAAAQVAGVTAGSTANLIYPEAVANLVTAADVRDVFIYDTRLDSDGGAWRMQSQHTSWHQEALNTATRGAKRDFPAVALMVAREASLTIYDLHDLDGSGAPRMWMVVPATNLYSGTGLRRAAALNGTILLTGSAGLLVYDFARDVVGRHLVSLYQITARSIATRAVGITINVASAGLVSNDVLDVAVRVLPGAMRDGAGLPIPTVAVATAGGISVIHPDGRVVSLTDALGHSAVSFLSDTHLSGIPGAATTNLCVYALPYATAAEAGARVATYAANGQAINYVIGGQSSLVANAVGGALGAVQFAHEIATNPSTGMVAVAAQTHATGWQPGDIRLATLCDGRTGALANDIRLTLDGTSVAGFSSTRSATITSTGGRIRVARNGVNDPDAGIVVSGLTVGETYSVDFDAYIGTAGAWFLVIAATGVGSSSDAVGARVQFVAEATSATLLLYATTVTGTNYAEFDNITIRAGVADRSYRARGLHAIGSLSRSPVGTGNDVVAFSGWSASNYLEQPYSSLLDFGTGDFSIALWVRGGINTEYLLDRRAAGTGAGAGFYIQMTSGNTFSFACTDGSSYPTVVSTSQANPSVWRFVVASRRSGVAEIWIDGVREATIAASMSVSASNPLRVGISSALSVPGVNVSLALFRIAAYAPTPAQIARMYRDEAPLFDAGAKAFLGGTSSAVNDLSFSEQSRRLAVATADGVSVFSGLRRVEYLSAGNLSPAMGANNTSKVALEAGALMVGTTANAGVRRDAITGLDRMQAAARAPFSPRRITARGVTTDATPLALAPRVHIGERETLIVQATIVGRVFGASDGQRIGYQRRATYYRDAGGNVTLQGSVQTIGTDTEVTGTADATLLIDTTAQTVTPQVTGVAATRIVWTATLETTRISDAQYEEIV
jgi:hypothetical protein